jgi:serine/threonine-protein kinase
VGGKPASPARPGSGIHIPQHDGSLWHLRDHLPALLLIALGFTLTLASALVVRSRAVHEAQANLERRSNIATQAMRLSLDVWLEVLEQLTTFFESSTEVTREDFRDYARPALARYPQIAGLGWLPRLDDADRAQFEEQVRASGFPAYQLREVDGSGTNLIRAGVRSEYLPVLYYEPPNDQAMGLDIYSSDLRRTPAIRARDSGHPVVSQRRRIVMDPPGVQSVVLHSPVYARGTQPPKSLDERRTAFVGVAVEVLRLDAIVERALTGVDTTGSRVTLVDLSAEGPDRVLWESSPALEGSEGFPHRSQEFQFADRNWQLTFAATTPDYGVPLPWGVLMGGFGATLLLAAATSARLMTRRVQREIELARTIGSYTLLEKISEGTMGVVFRARHALLRRPTALKVLDGGRDGEAELRRFEREVQLTSMLTHPNTIVVFDYGRTQENLFYYAMEYVDGLTLEALVRKYGPQPPARVARIMAQVCGSLAEAHASGLIHRDIKPSNIMLAHRGGIPDMVKVLDFGLVKQMDVASSISEDGVSFGTPLYVAPETLMHPGQISQSVDIYAAGLVMYYLLTGARGVRARTLVSILYEVVNTLPEPPSSATDVHIPSELDALVMECIEKDPAKRPASAEALRQRLLQFCDDGWTDEEAEAWWIEFRAHRPEVSHERAQGEVTIDLERSRAPARPASGGLT